MTADNFKAQLGRHSIALISLCVAIVSLSYNTWRNEHSEHNRNIRVAAFDQTSVDNIDKAIDEARDHTIQLIKSLR